ncbi:hypothetical protein [Petrimonas sulfuriphila]|uniref:hypothetical protein n=1 Tax=Petrimonas sulfuriphila TaxID=285070 RepID=UPI003EB8480F
MDVNKELRKQAIEFGLCQNWQKMWTSDKSPQKLIDMYKRGIDFCFESGYPANEFIISNFDNELLDKNNLFVDTEFYKVNPENDCVVLGKSSGKLIFGGFAVRDIYIKDDSELEIEASGSSKIFVNVYGNAKVHVIQKELATVNVYRHGECSISYSGNVVVRGTSEWFSQR